MQSVGQQSGRTNGICMPHQMQADSPCAMSEQNIQHPFRGYENTEVLIKHAALLEEFIRLQLSCPDDGEVSKLINWYLSDMKQMEKEMTVDINSCCSAELNCINKHYNLRRLTLIHDATSKLAVLKSRHSNTTTHALPIAEMTPIEPTTKKPLHVNVDNKLFGADYTVQYTRCSTLDEQISFPATECNPGLLHYNAKGTTTQLKCTKALPLDAVNVLRSWYENHRTAPSPTQEQLTHLVNVTGLTVSQIRKWLANKRLRSCIPYKQSGFMNPLQYHSAVRKLKHQHQIK